MSDMERNKQRRLRFLRAVYDLADGTPSHGVQGADVAERLGLDVSGEEFRALAYHHEQAGNIKALETNLGRIVITVKGIAEVESHASPESQRERRSRFLQIAYDMSINEPVPLVGLPDVAEKLGVDIDEASQIAHYYGNKRFIRSQADGYGIFSLTPDGIDEVEGNKPSDTGSTFQFYGPVQGSVIGTHNKAELTNTFDFRAIEQRIEREGGDDKEELKQALAQVERLLERGEYLDRGALARFSGAMERHSWFTGSVMQALLGFATQAGG